MKNLTHINPTPKTISYQLVLPMNMEVLIPETDSVRLLSEVMDQLDYSTLYQAYSRKGRKTAISPRNLFKVIVYGYMNNIYTSRSLERACRRDIHFMWLLEGAKAPDHNTIARFRSIRIAVAAEGLFYQFVKLLKERHEIDFDNLFVDGTKIEANANKYSFVWRKTTEKYAAKLRDKLAEAIEKIRNIHSLSLADAECPAEILAKLQTTKDKENIPTVSGTGKRKSTLQKSIEQLEELLARQKKYEDYEASFQGRNSFSKTDRDATFMHMKEDHMRNAQLKPGYNVQIGVEAEYIVGVDISSERSDALTLIPLLKKMDKFLDGKKYKNIIADAGYESEENYSYLEETKQTGYIKPSNYEKSKTSKYRKDFRLLENMDYDAEKDEYTCHNGKKLRSVGMTKRKSKSGYCSDITIYECEDCSQCPHKSACTKAVGNRRIHVSKKFQSQRSQSYQNITSLKGILLRMNRSIQVEGAFGVLKENHGFRRFLLRGKQNVRVEFLFLAMGYNVNKLHSKIQHKRCGHMLHEKEIA
ncbi:IS1182 family transposase [Sporomusa sp.]|uniref:IS1182 family transposase n=1 Tax=Sporomusa sp. TaxID=2078658 RepID=UPI002BE58F25|nr:IS1182 family transposase [Sporomusa sp.]HWR44576.1 IS1182 family transposase [Sporomusa sp.]